MKEVIIIDDKIIKKAKYVLDLKNKLDQKIKLIDFDFTQLRKADFLIHDFFLIDKTPFIVYKHNKFRLLLKADIQNEVFIIVKAYRKEKNHTPYYNEFREFAKKMP